MPTSDSARDVVLERLAAEFVERHRRGEHPPLSEYTGRFPDLAADIRDLFPALVQIEKLKPVSDPTGAFELAPAATGGPALERLGDYRIVREVGRGGMGVVYEAEQESLGRHVALKVLPASARLHPTYLERFRREAKAAAQMHHTNIVPVFGVGEADGMHFYAMQFIRGEGLDKVLADVRRLRQRAGAPSHAPSTICAEKSIAHSLLTGHFTMPAPSGFSESADRSATPPPSGLTVSGPEADYCRGVARIGVQVADALSYAHRQGILHRDIKPSNLLLDAQGTMWVTDFGLAKAEGTDELTNAGDIVGTIRFMAPERFEGKSLPQSDVYALGVTLYEMLTLRPALDDRNKAKLIDKVAHEAPVPPRRIDPRIPRDLETVVLKCLAKDPRERYPSAEALAEDLQRYLADRPIKARRATAREHLWRWCRRNPALATLSGALLLLLVVGAVGGVTMSVLLNGALGQAHVDRDKARAAERQGKQQLFESLVSDARARRFSGRAGQRFGTLESIRKAAALAHELEMPPATFDELRNLAIAALALPDIRMLKEWEGWPEGSRNLAFDERLEHYARDDTQGNFTVRRISDDVEVARRTGDGPNVFLDRFADGGRALILLDATDKSRKRWPFESTKAVPLGNLPARFAEDHASIPTADQKLLVSLDYKTGVIGVHDVATGKALHEIRFGKWAVAAQPPIEYKWDMHPWRHELAISMGAWHDPEREVVRILDLDQGKVTAELVANPPTYTHGQLSWHPDGRTLAVPYAATVELWDVPTATVVGRITEHKGGGLEVSVSRSGQLMSTHSVWAGGVKFWHPYTGKPLLSLPSMNIHPATHAPDGRMYAGRTVGTRLQLWASEPSPVLRVLVRNPVRGKLGGFLGYFGSAVHADGRLLAVGHSGGVALFDLARGLDIGHLDIGQTRSVQFDPVTGDLITAGYCGLLRWPLQAVPGDADAMRLGPPRQLPGLRAYEAGLGISRDGKVIAVSNYQHALVFHADRLDRPVVLKPLEDCRQLTVSPDGQWVVTGNHGDSDKRFARVWNAASGELVKELSLRDWSALQFSPDGQWLFGKNKTEGRFWKVGAWEEGASVPSPGSHDFPAFDPSSSFVAYERGDGAVRLVDRAAARQVAALESPDQGRTLYSSFSPDGKYLIGTNGDFPAINVWDLHELRKQLKELDLDWSATPYPSAAKPEPRSPGTPPLSVEIDSGGVSVGAKKRETARRLNADAWRLVAGPADQRDPARALKLIQQAVQEDPDTPTYWNTLGVAQYRNGKFREAVATLTKSLAAAEGKSDAFDLYFLAMCHARLADPAKARDCFDRAVQWTSEHKELSVAQQEELMAFRAEAEEVMRSAPAPK